MRKLWRLELLAYWLEPLTFDRGDWGPFITLAVITLVSEIVIGFRILSLYWVLRLG